MDLLRQPVRIRPSQDEILDRSRNSTVFDVSSSLLGRLTKMLMFFEAETVYFSCLNFSTLLTWIFWDNQSEFGPRISMYFYFIRMWLKKVPNSWICVSIVLGVRWPLFNRLQTMIRTFSMNYPPVEKCWLLTKGLFIIYLGVFIAQDPRCWKTGG